MNIFKILGFCFGLVLFSSINLQGQIITFQAGYVPGPSPDFNICVPDGVSTIVLVADTIPNAGSHIRHYVWVIDGVTQSDSKIITLPLNSSSSHLYNVSLQLNNASVVKIAAQNNFNFKIHHTPPTPVEIIPNPQIVYKGTTQYNLMNVFSSGVNSSKYSYSFTGDQMIPNGDFNKNAPVGDYHIFHYTANDNGFCQIGDSIYNTTIKVVDDQASLPTFIKSFEPLPICGNSSLVLMAALMNPACTTLTAPFIFLSDGVHTDAPPVLFQSVDDFTGAIMYFFFMKPNLFTSSSVNIVITSTCPKAGHSANYSGVIPITPIQPPSILGLPSPVNGYINLCSSLSDTVLMRGNPSGIQGSYYVYRGHPLVPGDPGYVVPGDTTFTLMNDSVLSYSTAYIPPANDPTLRKFTPMDLFNYIKDKPNDVIRITYYSPPPCGSSKDITIKFIPPVSVSFTKPADTVCYGKPVMFKVSGNPIGNPDQYLWSFGDESSFGYASDTIVYHNYQKPGMYVVRFRTLINNLNSTFCNNDVIDTIWVGAQPKAGFEVRQNFQNINAIFKSNAGILLNNTLAAHDTIYNWEYVFEPGIFVSQNTPDASHTYNNVPKNPYKVLQIVTARWGCKDTALSYIPVFPIRIPTASHSETDDFTHTDSTGWYESGQYKNADTTSSWQNITPQALNEHIIRVYPSGGDAWITSENPDPLAGYYNNEKSWVESPVYDISNLKLPMISLNTWTNFDNLFDGTALQYTFCDTSAFGREHWNTLGEIKNPSEIGKGLDWYTSNSIIAAPGGTLSGWTNDTLKNWKLSAYRLSAVLDSMNANPQNKLIRFRIVTGTNNDNTPGKFFDGFAFDNFFIGERNRRVIVEEFCDYLPQHHIPGIDTIFKDPQALRIQYHVRTLTTHDDINNQNMAEPGARALLYGVGIGLSRGVIDGIFEDNRYDLLAWGENAFFRRSLMVAPFNLNLKCTATDKLYITASVKRIVSSIKPKNYTVQIAVLEKTVTGNGIVFTNVLRNLVPNAAGNRIDKAYTWPNDSASFSVTWSPFIQPSSDLKVIVFIQDEDTKEIYQSNHDSVPYSLAHLLPSLRVGGSSITSVSFNEIALFPNPTSGDLKVLFNGILKENYQWKIIDAIGTEFNSGIFNQNIDGATLQTSELPDGIYYLKIEGEGQGIVKKFSVIR